METLHRKKTNVAAAFMSVSSDLLSRFTCNTKVIIDASSNPTDAYVKLL